jgi:hypothetical protein
MLTRAQEKEYTVTDDWCVMILSSGFGMEPESLSCLQERRTSFLIACEEGHTEAVVALLAVLKSQDYVIMNCFQEERTPLHIACEGGHTEVVSVLLTAGATLEDQDDVSPIPIGYDR